jgi:hypothetical protein
MEFRRQADRSQVGRELEREWGGIDLGGRSLAERGALRHCFGDPGCVRNATHEALEVEPFAEGGLMVVDGFAEALQPWNDDWPVAVLQREQHRSHAGVRYDHTRAADETRKLVEGQEVDAGRSRGREHGRSALHDHLLARAEIVELLEKAVEGRAVRPDGDEDHGVPVTWPA